MLCETDTVNEMIQMKMLLWFFFQVAYFKYKSFFNFSFEIVRTGNTKIILEKSCYFSGFAKVCGPEEPR